jgi:hypothetical protein
LFVGALLAVGLAGPVRAQDVPGGGGWSPAAAAAGDNTYQGFVDVPSAGTTVPVGSSFRVSGWFVDTTAEGWAGADGVQVLNGSTVLASGTVGGRRPDVASVTGNGFWAASGFDVVVPGGSLSAGPANLTVAVHTPGKGAWSKPLSVTIAGGGALLTSPASTGLILRVISPGVGDHILANKNGSIHGVAYDTRTRAELGVGVDRVQVYLDGARGVAGSENLGTANQVGNTWSLAWEPTKFDHVRQHHLWVYARSSVTGEERLLNLDIEIVPF